MQYPYSKIGKKYTIPDGVERVGDYAFTSTKLEDITLDEATENYYDHGSRL